jgi:hypothetical protein
MWATRSDQLDHGRGVKVRIDLEGHPITFSDVLRRWQDDPVFRSFFIALLANAPFSAFRWETPPVTTDTVGRSFEFVLLDSPELVSQPDPDAFGKYFADLASSPTVVSFPNLRNDAILVVPRPDGPVSAYGHLAAFVRRAPEAQRHALWSLVGNLMEQRLGRSPVWLSTAGSGVSWLHVRLDQQPKYYGHAPYRDAASVDEW